MNLTDLPRDYHTLIIAYLRDRHLKNLRLTCKIFSNVCYTNFREPVSIKQLENNTYPYEIIVNIVITQENLYDIATGKLVLPKRVYALTLVGEFDDCSHLGFLPQITHLFISKKFTTKYSLFFRECSSCCPPNLTHFYWFPDDSFLLLSKLPSSITYLFIRGYYSWSIHIPDHVKTLKLGKKIGHYENNIKFGVDSQLQKIEFDCTIDRTRWITIPSSVKKIVFSHENPTKQKFPAIADAKDPISAMTICSPNRIISSLKNYLDYTVFPYADVKYIVKNYPN